LPVACHLELNLKTTDVDVRQIRVFLAVAQSGGFSAAQDVLNLAQSTISTEIAALEARLGYTLCKRGRGGFKLTPQGEAFVNDATALLSALSLFEISVAKHKKQGLGDVRIAIIDNLVTDPNCPLIGAFDRFHRRTGGRAHIYLDVLSPREIEQRVSSGKIDAAIGIFTETLPHLRYVPLYKERDVLVCGSRHPLFEEKSDVRLFSRIRNAQKVVRTFLKLKDFFFLSDQHNSITAHVDSVEAAAVLILAGSHIGFLPDHYAQRWVDRGEMRVMVEKSYTRQSELILVHHQDPSRLGSTARILVQELAGYTSDPPMKKSKVTN
jgi:LysR family transcriptional regulator, transcriptional activator for bauABCD operon